MINPSLNELMKKVDCRYTLAVFAAKRAREILSGEPPSLDSDSNKPVTIAIEEIARDKIRYQRTKDGIK